MKNSRGISIRIAFAAGILGGFMALCIATLMMAYQSPEQQKTKTPPPVKWILKHHFADGKCIEDMKPEHADSAWIPGPCPAEVAEATATPPPTPIILPTSTEPPLPTAPVLPTDTRAPDPTDVPDTPFPPTPTLVPGLPTWTPVPTTIPVVATFNATFRAPPPPTWTPGVIPTSALVCAESEEKPPCRYCCPGAETQAYAEAERALSEAHLNYTISDFLQMLMDGQVPEFIKVIWGD